MSFTNVMALLPLCHAYLEAMIDHSNQLDHYALQASLRKVHVDQMLNVPMHKIKAMQSCNNLMDQSLTSFLFPHALVDKQHDTYIPEQPPKKTLVKKLSLQNGNLIIE